MANTEFKDVQIQLRRATTAQWELHKDFVPAEGEPCYDLDTGSIKYGDGITTYEDLKESGVAANHYEGVRNDGESDNDVITRVLNAATASPKKDDTFVIKTLISGEKYSYTAFVYTGSVWAAMDGNYDAKNVIFDSDLIMTQQFGKYKPDSSGSVTVPASSKSIYDVLMGAYSEESNPKTIQPTASIKLNQAGSYEAGAKVTPSYSASLNAGSYTYGPATEVVPTAYKVTDSNGVEKTTATGSFSEIQVTDTIDYKLTAEITHSEGKIPVTNLGNDYSAGKIVAGTKTANSNSIKAFRNSFYGSITSKPDAMTSAIIRGEDVEVKATVAKSNKALANGATVSISYPIGAMRAFIAYPATLRDITSIKDVNGLNAECLSSWTKTTVEVTGANGYDAINYKVYYLDAATANDKANTFTVII